MVESRRVQMGGEHIQRKPHCTHTHTHFFLVAHDRTPGVITHLAPGLDDLFVCLKNHSIIGHVFVERSFDPISSYFLHLLSH